MQDPYLQDMKYLNELKEIVERQKILVESQKNELSILKRQLEGGGKEGKV